MKLHYVFVYLILMFCYLLFYSKYMAIMNTVACSNYFVVAMSAIYNQRIGKLFMGKINKFLYDVIRA